MVASARAPTGSAPRAWRDPLPDSAPRMTARAFREWLPAVVVFVVVLVVWEVSLLAFGIQSFLIPRPSVIAGSLVSEWSTLAKGIVFTGTEAVGGLIVGVALGTLSGLATARWATARELLLPVAIGASAIPIIAFAPITLNWFGPESILPRLTIVALMVFFPVMINTIRGLTNVEPAALELLSSYAASERQTLAKLRAPNALPYWFTALRIATTLSVIGAVVGEFFGGPLYSLGIYITLESGQSRYPTAWAAIVVACAMGIGLYLVAVAIERLVMPWGSARESAR
jgi:NitT/TauT family transport system permease protein